MRKAFETKIYAKDGTYLSTVDPNLRMSDYAFSAQIDGGQGECRIALAVPFEQSPAAQGDFVRVFVHDDVSPLGRVVFCWRCDLVRRVYESGKEYVELRVLGLGSVLEKVKFKSGWSYVFSKNQDVAQTVMDALDSYAADADFPFVTYVPAEIVPWPTANLSFDHETVGEVVKRCAAVAWYSWRIEPDGRLLFFPKPDSPSHKPSLQADVLALEVDDDAEGIVNRYRLKWASGTVQSEDAASVAQYGLREEYEEDSGILDATTAQAKADAFVAQNKDPKRKASMTLSGKYRFVALGLWLDDEPGVWDDTEIWLDADAVGTTEDVRPGQTVSVLNSAYALADLQIVRVSYTPEEISVELDGYDAFAKEVTGK